MIQENGTVVLPPPYIDVIVTVGIVSAAVYRRLRKEETVHKRCF
jgi:hypothetical protein